MLFIETIPELTFSWFYSDQYLYLGPRAMTNKRSTPCLIYCQSILLLSLVPLSLRLALELDLIILTQLPLNLITQSVAVIEERVYQVVPFSFGLPLLCDPIDRNSSQTNRITHRPIVQPNSDQMVVNRRGKDRTECLNNSAIHHLHLLRF